MQNIFRSYIRQDYRRLRIAENPVWRDFFTLWDDTLNKKAEVVSIVDRSMVLARRFLLSANDKKELESIVVALQQLFCLIIAVYDEEYEKAYDQASQDRLFFELDSFDLTKNDDYQDYIARVTEMICICGI